MAFDPKCYELAEYFLAEYLPNKLATESDISILAGRIQDEIEDYLEDRGL